jgi:hypothetical protein
MKQKLFAALAVAAVAFSLCACGGAASSTASSTDAAEQETTAADPLVVYESPLGYSVEYNTEMFTLTSGSDSDRFECIGVEDLQAPIYVAVTAYPDMDAETVANGIVLQVGRDDVTAENGTFGDEVDGWMIHYDEEAGGLHFYYSYFAVPQGEGTLLLEAGEYVDFEGQEEVDGNIELIIDSFAPQAG